MCTARVPARALLRRHGHVTSFPLGRTTSQRRQTRRRSGRGSGRVCGRRCSNTAPTRIRDLHRPVAAPEVPRSLVLAPLAATATRVDEIGRPRLRARARARAAPARIVREAVEHEAATVEEDRAV